MAEKQQEVRVVWIAGNRNERKKILEKIKAKIGDHETIRLSDDILHDQLCAAVLADDCFGTQRMVIVEAMPQPVGSRQKMMNDLKKLVEHVPENCLLVFNGIDPDDQKAMFGAVSKVGKVFRYDDRLNLNDAVKYITDELAAEEKTIESPEATAFVKSLPSDEGKEWEVDMLSQAVLKLSVYMDKRKKVEPEDVAAVGSSEGFVSVWQLFDAIDRSDFCAASDIFYHLLPGLVATEYSVNASVTKFFSTCQWRFRAALMAKELMMRKMQPAEAAAQIATITRFAQEGVGMNMRLKPEAPAYSQGWAQNLIGYSPDTSVLGRYTLPRLIQIVKAIEESCEYVRHIGEDEQAILLVDLFLLLACGKIDDSRRRTLSAYFDGCSEI